jgi:excisionase family DNA binding protein
MESKDAMLQPRPASGEEVLTVSQVAEILQLNYRTILRRFEDGTIPAKRIGSKPRCTRKSLDAYLDSPDNNHGAFKPSLHTFRARDGSKSPRRP